MARISPARVSMRRLLTTAGSATGSPILVAAEIVFVWRIKPGQLRAFRDFTHDPGLHALLLRGGASHVLDESGRDQHGAVVVNHNKIVGIDGDAAAADRLLPIDEGEAAHGGRGGCARAPEVEAGVETP